MVLHLWDKMDATCEMFQKNEYYNLTSFWNNPQREGNIELKFSIVFFFLPRGCCINGIYGYIEAIFNVIG